MAVASSKIVKSVVRYNPNPAPVEVEQLPDYLFNELNRVGDIIFNIDTLRLEPTNTPNGPTKPRDGDIRYADGTNWNPGSGGEGIYAYFNATWNKL